MQRAAHPAKLLACQGCEWRNCVAGWATHRQPSTARRRGTLRVFKGDYVREQVTALMREKANLVTRNGLLERVVALKEEQQQQLKQHSPQDEVTPLLQAPGLTFCAPGFRGATPAMSACLGAGRQTREPEMTMLLRCLGLHSCRLFLPAPCICCHAYVPQHTGDAMISSAACYQP